MAIQMRRGLRADFDPTQLVAGEWAVSVDSSTSNQIVWMCFGAGVVKRMGTYEDFQAMISEISEDLEEEFEDALRASVATIEAEVQALADAVSDDADAVATAKSTIEDTDIPAIQTLVGNAQTYANNASSSAQNASSSAQSASNSASSASSSATSANSAKDTAVSKATEAQSWAIGGTGTRAGEDTNNAKYWSERAQSTSLAQSDWTQDDNTQSSYIAHKPFKTVGAGLSVDNSGAINVTNPGTTNYNDLSSKPSVNGIELSGNKTLSQLGIMPASTPIPSKTSDLNNDSGFITSSALPTKTSDLNNDSGFVTSADVPTKTSDLTNDSNFITRSAYASANSAGTVKPDGSTTQVDANGVISVIGGGGGGDVSKDDLTSISATGTTNDTGATITSGLYFYLNDTLCRALADIANGATFTLNTNYEEVTAGGLNALNTNLTSKMGAPNWSDVTDITSSLNGLNKTYTATKTGYIYINAECSGTGALRFEINNLSSTRFGHYFIAQNDNIIELIPIAVGDTIKTVTRATGVSDSYAFVGAY